MDCEVEVNGGCRREVDDIVQLHVLAGSMKGIGRVYLQTVMDCYSLHTRARLCTSKLPLTAVHILNNEVLPFFDSHKARVTTLPSNNGRKFCDRPHQFLTNYPYNWKALDITLRVYGDLRAMDFLSHTSR
jgi:hypothetical protein